MRARQQRYEASAKGRATQARYNRTTAGLARSQRYSVSEQRRWKDRSRERHQRIQEHAF
jgi:hypothetical protein